MTKLKSKLDLGRLFLLAMLCTLACCDPGGGCGTGGTCNHPWDGLPGSCAIPGANTGQLGGACHSITSLTGELCDANLRCDDQVCIPCGTNGGTCCDPGPNSGGVLGACTDGSTCTEGGDFGICDATCGMLTAGKDDCCAGNACGPGNTCEVSTGKCVAAAMADKCSDMTQQPKKIAFLGANKCFATTQTFRAKPADLAGCIASFATSHGATACAQGDVQVHQSFCDNTDMLGGPFSDDVEICSSESAPDIHTCELSKCSAANDCTITAPGTCPNG